MEQWNQSLPPELEDLARWLAEDSEAEDELHRFSPPEYGMQQYEMPQPHSPPPYFSYEVPYNQPAVAWQPQPAAYGYPSPQPPVPMQSYYPPQPPSPPIMPPQPMPSVPQWRHENNTVPDMPLSTLEDIRQLHDETDVQTEEIAAPKKPRSKARRFVNIITSMFIVMVLLATLAMLTLPQLLSTRGIHLITELYQQAGAVLVVREQSFEEVQVGDYITFMTPGDIAMTSRVIEINPIAREFITQGTTVRYENMIGQAQFYVPVVGYALNWLEPTANKVIAVSLIVGVWLMLFLVEKNLGNKSKHESIGQEGPLLENGLGLV